MFQSLSGLTLGLNVPDELQSYGTFFGFNPFQG